MTFLSDFLSFISNVISNATMSFRFLIALGLIALLMGAVPSITVAVLKKILGKESDITKDDITRSRAFFAITACVLFLIGYLGLFLMPNKPPSIDDILVDPRVYVTSPSGEQVNITVTASDPDASSQKIFLKYYPLQYEYFIEGPRKDHNGPIKPNSWLTTFYPNDNGEHRIRVIVSDGPYEYKDAKNTTSSKNFTVVSLV